MGNFVLSSACLKNSISLYLNCTYYSNIFFEFFIGLMLSFFIFVLPADNGFKRHNNAFEAWGWLEK